jgi:hypothetical protein
MDKGRLDRGLDLVYAIVDDVPTSTLDVLTYHSMMMMMMVVVVVSRHNFITVHHGSERPSEWLEQEERVREKCCRSVMMMCHDNVASRDMKNDNFYV